jgi:hypothetical protein
MADELRKIEKVERSPAGDEEKDVLEVLVGAGRQEFDEDGCQQRADFLSLNVIRWTEDLVRETSASVEVHSAKSDALFEMNAAEEDRQRHYHPIHPINGEDDAHISALRLGAEAVLGVLTLLDEKLLTNRVIRAAGDKANRRRLVRGQHAFQPYRVLRLN